MAADPDQVKLVQVIEVETVKPLSPTPDHLKTMDFSVFDQLAPQAYMPTLHFYPNNINTYTDHAQRFKLLIRSLSKTLSHFYPFAGELQDNVSISCNDRGVLFLAAQVSCPILKILDRPNLGMLRQLVPSKSDTQGRSQELSGAGYLLLIQANFFECGGLAIGVRCSHKVADAFTFTKFINTWAAISLASAATTTNTNDHGGEICSAASLFPPLDSLNSPAPAPKSGCIGKEKSVSRRFVFDAAKMAALKSKCGSPTVPYPTRVEAVSALIWKCANEASRISNSGSIRPSAWCHMVNMRKSILLGEDLKRDLLGNAVAMVAAKTDEEDHGHDLKILVAKLRKGVEEFKKGFDNGVYKGENLCRFVKGNVNLLKGDDMDTYLCSSWCRMQFYKADFGWGEPSWVSIPSWHQKNTVILLDANDGHGVEAAVTLKEEEMAIFENNVELLQYATLNPSAIC